MVGVPGRARSCITCRRRKKGCDRQEPVCNRCVRAGLTCEGYDKDLVWLNSTSPGSFSQQSGDASQPQAVPDIRSWMVSYTKKSSGNTQIALPDSFVLSAREQLYIGLFWSIMIPNGPNFSPESANLSSIGWMKFIGQFYDSEAALRYATIAIAASTIGRTNHDSQLRLKGLQVYNWTIQEMVKAMKNPTRAKSDGIIASSRTMALYELLFGHDGEPQVAGWNKHSEGQMAMFLERGPTSFTSGASHQLFIDSRMNMTLLAIRLRIASPFSAHEWKTVPFTVIAKTTQGKLIDIMDDMPGLLAQVESIKTCGSTDAAEKICKRILHSCGDMEAALATWKTHIDLNKYDYTIEDLPLPIPSTDTEFSHLHLSCLYWSICLMLYSTKSSITRAVNSLTNRNMSKMGMSTGSGQQPKAAKHSKSEGHDSCSDPRVYASKIAHCAHLFFEPSAGVVQGGSGPLPILTALRFYQMTETYGPKIKDFQLLHDVFSLQFVGSPVGRYLAHLQGDFLKCDSDNSSGDATTVQNNKWF